MLDGPAPILRVRGDFRLGENPGPVGSGSALLRRAGAGTPFAENMRSAISGGGVSELGSHP